MRCTIVFFLLLCSVLFGGYNDVYSEVHHNSTTYGTTAWHIDKIQQVKFENTNKVFPVVKNNSVTEKKEESFSLEDEDEEVMPTRRYILVKYFTTLVHASILICFYSYFKNRLPFCSYLSYTSSYKYILQRVLRL